MQLNVKLSISYAKLHTTTKLPPASKEYLCFWINGKSYQAAKCVKSRILTKFIDSILSIYAFEKKLLCLKVCYNCRVSKIT